MSTPSTSSVNSADYVGHVYLVDLVDLINRFQVVVVNLVNFANTVKFVYQSILNDIFNLADPVSLVDLIDLANRVKLLAVSIFSTTMYMSISLISSTLPTGFANLVGCVNLKVSTTSNLPASSGLGGSGYRYRPHQPC